MEHPDQHFCREYLFPYHMYHLRGRASCHWNFRSFRNTCPSRWERPVSPRSVLRRRCPRLSRYLFLKCIGWVLPPCRRYRYRCRPVSPRRRTWVFLCWVPVCHVAFVGVSRERCVLSCPLYLQCASVSHVGWVVCPRH